RLRRSGLDEPADFLDRRALLEALPPIPVADVDRVLGALSLGRCRWVVQVVGLAGNTLRLSCHQLHGVPEGIVLGTPTAICLVEPAEIGRASCRERDQR